MSCFNFACLCPGLPPAPATPGVVLHGSAHGIAAVCLYAACDAASRGSAVTCICTPQRAEAMTDAVDVAALDDAALAHIEFRYAADLPAAVALLAALPREPRLLVVDDGAMLEARDPWHQARLFGALHTAAAWAGSTFLLALGDGLPEGTAAGKDPPFPADRCTHTAALLADPDGGGCSLALFAAVPGAASPVPLGTRRFEAAGGTLRPCP